jgi:hypothetical protein
VLRGAPKAGPASDDMLAIDKPTPTMHVCLAGLHELSEADGGLAAAVTERRPALLALDRACGPELQGVVVRSVAHQDACSPFLVGVRAEPAAITRYLEVAHLVGLRARMLADKDPEAGLALALDIVRFGQDFGRATSLVNVVIGSVVAEIGIESARNIVAQRRLALADLDAATTTVDALLATEPPIAASLSAELEHFLLHVAMAPNQPDGWQAPGGWPDGKRPAREANVTIAHPRDVAAMVFLAGDIVAEHVADACRPSASLAACHGALDRLVQTRPDGEVPALYARIMHAILQTTDLSVDDVRMHLRHQIAEVLANEPLAQFRSSVARRGATVARLGSLRLQLEVEKVIARTRWCPAAIGEQFVVGLGDYITATVDTRTITISPPTWARRETVPYTIVCP